MLKKGKINQIRNNVNRKRKVKKKVRYIKLETM